MFRIRYRWRGRARIEDRPAEIAWQRRPELWRAAGQVGIVLGQIRQAVRRVPVVGAVEFGANRLALRLKREKQRPADAKRGDCAEAR